MRIGIISPYHHAGVTTVALMLGQCIASTQAASVCLTYTGENQSIKRYIGINDVQDATRSISQVVKLLNANAIQPGDLGDYTIKLGTNLELMDTYSNSITPEESADVLSYVLEHIQRDVVICDISSELDSPETQAIFDKCDQVIMVIEPSTRNIEAGRMWLESSYWPKKLHTMLLVNKYSPEIMPLSEAAKTVGIKMRDTCKLHYHPLIMKESNKQVLDTVMPFIIARDYRVIELNSDLKECVQFLFSNMSLKTRWEAKT